MKRVKKSFSLIEVLVFITILSLFFVAAMTITSYSLRSMKTQEYKILATHYAEEASEWVKSEKESNWTQFITYDLSAGAGTTYCLNTSDLNWSSSSQCQDFNFGTPAIFKREVLIKNIGSPIIQVTANIIVSWQDINGENNVTLNNSYNLLE